MAEPITHLEKTIAGEVTPVTHLEQVISEYGGGNVYDSLEAGVNITIEETSDGKAKISASGEVSSEDAVARADIAAIKDGTTIDSFGDVETALSSKADTSTTYTKSDVDTALGGKVDKVQGKGLSTEDYSTSDKTKLGALAEIKSVGTGLSLNSSTGELTATGGSGGTTDYSDLSNKPKINSVELSGNKSLSDLGAQPTIDSSHKLSADNVDDTNTTNKFATATQLSQIGTNANNISSIQNSLAVGSTDDAKVLTASYSGGVGTYSWSTPSGGGAVTGVKGNEETNYRTGNVSLSAANVGAIPTTEKGANGGVAALDSNGKIAADKIAAGALASGMTATTQSISDDSTKLATTAYVHDVVDALPSPMVYKGTLGTGGTITTLPVDGSATVGDTYKVITAGTYASQAAKVGDMFICLTKSSNANTWSYVPSGDDTDVTQVSAGTGLTTASGSPITSTGTIKAKLKSSTALAEAATNSTTTGKSYAVNVDSAGDLACNVPWTDTTYNNATTTTAGLMSAQDKTDLTITDITGDYTASSGYTVKTNLSGIYKQGKHIFGTLIIQIDTGTITQNSQIAIATTTHKPNKSYVGYCGFATTEWALDDMGYITISQYSGEITVNNTKSGASTTVNIHIDYMVS